MTSTKLFLPDSNIFIESSRQHYLFDYKEFHPFWKWLESLNASKEIVMLDSVYDELTKQSQKGKVKEMDFLGTWVASNFTKFSHKTDEIGAAYVEIQDYLANCDLYTQESYEQWAPESKADPWLIAAAMTLDATIVTNEVTAHPRIGQKMKREPKIPDVAAAFNVKTMNLRQFFDVNGQLTQEIYPVQPHLPL